MSGWSIVVWVLVALSIWYFWLPLFATLMFHRSFWVAVGVCFLGWMLFMGCTANYDTSQVDYPASTNIYGTPVPDCVYDNTECVNVTPGP